MMSVCHLCDWCLSMLLCRQGVIQDADGICECHGRQTALQYPHVLVPASGAVPSGGNSMAIILDRHHRQTWYAFNTTKLQVVSSFEGSVSEALLRCCNSVAVILDRHHGQTWYALNTLELWSVHIRSFTHSAMLHCCNSVTVMLDRHHRQT